MWDSCHTSLVPVGTCSEESSLILISYLFRSRGIRFRLYVLMGGDQKVNPTCHIIARLLRSVYETLGFASQLAFSPAYVTISNTCEHASSILYGGINCTVFRRDACMCLRYFIVVIVH